MKVSAVEILAVDVPVDFPYGEARSVPAAVARLRTDDGLEGLGHAMPLYGKNFGALVAAVREQGDLIVGEDPRQPERIHHRISPSPAGGIVTMATAAIDVAIWDLAGKVAGLPLWRMLGGF